MRVPATCPLGNSRAAREPLPALGEAEAYESLDWSIGGADEKKGTFQEWEDIVEGESRLHTLELHKKWSPGGSKKKVRSLEWEGIKEEGGSFMGLQKLDLDKKWSPGGSTKKVGSSEWEGIKEEDGSFMSLQKCSVCDKPADDKVCHRCTLCLKTSLLDVDLTSVGMDNTYYCFECADIVYGEHGQHEDQVIRLDKFSGSVIAWVIGQERCASLFHGIQDADAALQDLELGPSISSTSVREGS